LATKTPRERYGFTKTPKKENQNAEKTGREKEQGGE
jgi:hypothetical protein